MIRLFTVFAIGFLALGITDLAGAQGLGSDSSMGLPESYAKDYLLAANTMSPDKKFAVIYPRFEIADRDDRSKLKNYFVRLEPFAIIDELDTAEPYFQNQSNGGISTEWSTDRSVALITWEGKWGPRDVLLLELRDAKVSRTTQLLGKVRELLLPNYRNAKPKPEPYNDTMGFIFTDVSATLDGTKLVKIGATATTSPNGMVSPVWKGEVEATWDIAQAKFTAQQISGSVRKINTSR